MPLKSFRNGLLAKDTAVGRTPAIRTTAMPADTNPAGDIFGGWLMAQMDLAAGNVAAINRTDETLVAAINPVNDKTPTLGRKRGFFDELPGNVGVFNSGALGQTNPEN